MQIAMFNGQPVGQLFNGGTADISFDDTMLQKEDGSYSVTTPVKSVLTQEEFDALPEEERSKGLYIIEDPASTGGNSSVSTPSQHIYSTEETVIGRWIDGRPLYRRVFEATVTLTDTRGVYTLVPKSLYGECHNLSIKLKAKNWVGSYWLPYVDVVTDSSIRYMSPVITSAGASIVGAFPASSDETVFDATLTLEYTKSTDTPST